MVLYMQPLLLTMISFHIQGASPHQSRIMKQWYAMKVHGLIGLLNVYKNDIILLYNASTQPTYGWNMTSVF